VTQTCDQSIYVHRGSSSKRTHLKKHITSRKRKSDTLEAEEDTAETARRGRNRKSAALDAPAPMNKIARISNAPKPASALVSRTQIAEDEIAPEPQRAPVARM
jgi:hypothetical protein